VRPSPIDQLKSPAVIRTCTCGSRWRASNCRRSSISAAASVANEKKFIVEPSNVSQWMRLVHERRVRAVSRVKIRSVSAGPLGVAVFLRRSG